MRGRNFVQRIVGNVLGFFPGWCAIKITKHNCSHVIPKDPSLPAVRTLTKILHRCLVLDLVFRSREIRSYKYMRYCEVISTFSRIGITQYLSVHVNILNMIFIEIYRVSRVQLNYPLSSLILWEARNAFLTFFILPPLWKSIFHDPILMITPHEWLKAKKASIFITIVLFYEICHLIVLNYEPYYADYTKML